MRRCASRLAAAALTIAAALGLPAVALAHPLGNFTVNHYAGIRVEPDRVRIDAVIDSAEIPTFEAMADIDTDGDGDVSATENERARMHGCDVLSAKLALTVDGAPASLRTTAAGLSFPAGAAGLQTMRLVCELEAPLAQATAAMQLSFRDDYLSTRIGWREIVVDGDRTTVSGDIGRAGRSERLTAYPKDLLAQPLDVRAVTFSATAGGPALPAFEAPDAQRVAGAAARGGVPAASTPIPSALPAAATTTRAAAAVPGGAGADVPTIFGSGPLDASVILVALATAIALGAGHAITPGHGKTLMAAYLVGTRGTPIHAVALGLAVSVSHTMGILALALVIGDAGAILPPDTVVRAAPIVAAVTMVAIGTWMVAREVRGVRARRLHAAAHAHVDPHSDAHGHAHADGRTHAHDHAHEHLPVGGSITWRSLFALGLAGGLIPSTSALLILLATIAAGRAAYGVVLVIAFGLGMAAVMTGVGLAVVFARGRLMRMDVGPAVGRVRGIVPIAAAIAVLVIGVYLTGQAVGQPTL